MLIRFTEPSDRELQAFLDRQRSATYSYPAVGSSRELQIPQGYRPLHHRILLGKGREAFASAKAAVREWRMFDMPWIRIFPGKPSLNAGQDVVILARIGGIRFLNVCRVVYAVDEEDRFGFAYGTLRGHVESGEERFWVERSASDDSVWYDLHSFARPSLLVYRAAGAYLRMLQRRFARQSLRMMQKTVGLRGQ